MEIQIRNREHHDWATLVEISDVIIPESRLKEYHTPSDLAEFHRILSAKEDSLTEEEKKTYFKVLEKLPLVSENATRVDKGEVEFIEFPEFSPITEAVIKEGE